MNGYARNTWKDTVGCTAVLLTILLSTLSGVYVVFTEPAPAEKVALSTEA